MFFILIVCLEALICTLVQILGAGEHTHLQTALLFPEPLGDCASLSILRLSLFV